jgi:putative membrane protein insertion efficiency factor
MKKVAIFLIKVYKTALSPVLTSLFGRGCKYSPTCSEYAMEAIKRHGMVLGGKLATKRFVSCHPFSKGGYNPVPKLIK